MPPRSGDVAELPKHRTPLPPTDRAVYLCPACHTTRLLREVRCGYCGFDIRACADSGFDRQVIRALSDPEPETAVRAAFLLGIRHPPDAIDLLIPAYHSSRDLFVRRQALASIDMIGGDAAAALLQEAARDDHIVLRAEALGRLIVHEGPDGPAASAARSDPSVYVRWMAHRALARAVQPG